MYSVNLVLELSLSFTKIGLADQFLEITLPCWKSSLRGRSRRFEKESPRSISWRKKGCCAIGRGGVKVVSAIGRGRVKGVSASELLPCRCLIKMPSFYCTRTISLRCAHHCSDYINSSALALREMTLYKQHLLLNMSWCSRCCSATWTTSSPSAWWVACSASSPSPSSPPTTSSTSRWSR